MVLCGPTADTATLKVNAEVRVYEQQHADRGYTIHACVPGGRPYKLGDKRIVSLRIGGRYVAVIRRGETLHVYDVRKRRRVGLTVRATRFTQYRVTRFGTVAYLAETPYGQFIGSPFSPCSSHTDCGEGVARLQFARDRYVITDGVTVYDLARRVTRRCEDVAEICATASG